MLRADLKRERGTNLNFAEEFDERTSLLSTYNSYEQVRQRKCQVSKAWNLDEYLKEDRFRLDPLHLRIPPPTKDYD